MDDIEVDRRQVMRAISGENLSDIDVNVTGLVEDVGPEGRKQVCILVTRQPQEMSREPLSLFQCIPGGLQCVCGAMSMD